MHGDFMFLIQLLKSVTNTKTQQQQSVTTCTIICGVSAWLHCNACNTATVRLRLLRDCMQS